MGSVVVIPVREVDLSVVEQLSKIEEASFGPGGMNAWFLSPFIRYGRVFAAFEAGVPVGVAEYMRVLEPPAGAGRVPRQQEWRPELFLFGLCVSPDRRGRGIATKILDESIAYLREEGFRRLELTVDPKNPVVPRLYSARKGFFVIGKRQDEYGAGIHRMVLGLELDKYPALAAADHLQQERGGADGI